MRRRGLLVIALTNLLIFCALAFGVKALYVWIADTQAENLLKSARSDRKIETAERAAFLIYKSYAKDGYSDDSVAKTTMLRRVYTNRLMPSLFRVPEGAFELAMMQGWCDDAARALIYTLAKENIPAKQWNMQGPASAHAAVVAEIDGERMLLDPYYGFYSVRDGKPVPPEKAKDNLVAFDKNSRRGFYDGYDDLAMGAAGEPLTITANIPPDAITLGALDGSSGDMRAALGKARMTLVWDYAGHKYDRGWTRELVAGGQVKVEIILTQAANENVLRTLSPAPTVDGTKLTWHLLKDGKITSQDGKAGISLARLNSYIDVDQIVITPEKKD